MSARPHGNLLRHYHLEGAPPGHGRGVLRGLLRLLQVREELMEVEKRVAEMDGNSDSAMSEYTRLKQVSPPPLMKLSSLPRTEAAVPP